MSEDEFWDMLPRTFYNKQHGFFEHHEYLQREEWERTRWLAGMNIQPHLKKGTKMKPTDLCRFPWDPKPKSSKLDEKQKRLNAEAFLNLKKRKEKLKKEKEKQNG